MAHAHAALMALRLLLRDEKFQHLLMTGSDPLPVLVQALSRHIQLHFSSSLGQPEAAMIQVNTDLLKELTSNSIVSSVVQSSWSSHADIFQKLSNNMDYRQRLVDAGVHSLLVQLLESHDLVPLQCSLCALINLSKTYVAPIGFVTCLSHVCHVSIFLSLTGSLFQLVWLLCHVPLPSFTSSLLTTLSPATWPLTSYSC